MREGRPVSGQGSEVEIVDRSPENGQPLVTIEGLRKYYPLPRPLRDIALLRPAPVVRACDDVSLTIRSGETLGLVGESGSGKTTVGRLLLALERPDEGMIEFDGADLLDLERQELRRVRRQMQLVFQDPLSSLNPRHSVLQAVAHPLRTHGEIRSASEGLDRVVELLGTVGLPATIADRFPHELSGGQAQRVCIARAIALRPKLIVADEPTSALDVSVQAQILNLLKRLQQQLGMAYLFISHDLRVVSHLSDRVAVMYAGQIVESGTTADVFGQPRHPYTKALLESVPRPKLRAEQRGEVIRGEALDVATVPPGCRFEPRCPYSRPDCLEPQSLRSAGTKGRQVRCVLDRIPEPVGGGEW